MIITKVRRDNDDRYDVIEDSIVLFTGSNIQCQVFRGAMKNGFTYEQARVLANNVQLVGEK